MRTKYNIYKYIQWNIHVYIDYKEEAHYYTIISIAWNQIVHKGLTNSDMYFTSIIVVPTSHRKATLIVLYVTIRV